MYMPHFIFSSYCHWAIVKTIFMNMKEKHVFKILFSVTQTHNW